METNTDILIAEFMGMDIGHGHMVIDINGRNWTMPKFKFSWDWLMKVVDRIESLNLDDGTNYPNVTIGATCYCVIQDSNGELFEFTGEQSSKILSVYHSVVDFINWYNNHICRECKGVGKPSKGIMNYHNIQTQDKSKEFETKLEDCIKCTKCGHSWIN